MYQNSNISLWTNKTSNINKIKQFYIGERDIEKIVRILRKITCYDNYFIRGIKLQRNNNDTARCLPRIALNNPFIYNINYLRKQFTCRSSFLVLIAVCTIVNFVYLSSQLLFYSFYKKDNSLYALTHQLSIK